MKFSSVRTPLIALLALVSLCLSGLGPSNASLENRIRNLVANAGLKKAKVAISIRDCRNARELVSINATRPMLPASNMKVVSTGAALLTLGPDFFFETTLRRAGNDLVLVGDGDPTLGDPELIRNLRSREPNDALNAMDHETLLASWVNAARGVKMTEIDRLIVDDQVFDAQRVHDTWPRDQLNRQYCAEVAGLNFHGNTVEFLPAPGSPRPNWSTHAPRAPWLLNDAVNKSENASAKEKHAPWIAGKAASPTFQFRGNVKTRSTLPVTVTVEDPSIFMARVLRDRLANSNMHVNAIHRAVQRTPDHVGEVIGPRIRTPISIVVEQCNEDSDNLYAEALLKRTVFERTGRPGSWAEADAVIKGIAHERLHPRDRHLAKDVFIADGSGLSRSNRVSASFLTAWLCALESDPKIGELFVSSLALGGVEGTLDDRFRRELPGGGRVEAKTGYINGVSGLSGYVTMNTGERFAFSVLVNNISGTTQPAKKLQEQVVDSIARHFGG